MRSRLNLNYITRMENKVMQLKTAQQRHQEFQDNSLETFIMIDVFNEFNHKRNSDNHPQECNIDFSEYDAVEAEAPKVDELRSGTSALESILQQKNILVIGETSYVLAPSTSQQGGRIQLSFWNKPYTAIDYQSISQLAKIYRQALIHKVEHLVESKAENYIKALAKLDSVAQNAEVNLPKSAKGTTHAKRGDIGFAKINDNQYAVYVIVPEFLMGKNGNYYHFGNAEITMPLKFNGTSLAIENPPQVLNIPYSHPFVHSNGAICYDGSERWSELLGIKFSYFYPISDSNLPLHIANALREARRGLHKGYMGRTVRPVNNLSEFPIVANGKDEALQYAVQRGIPKLRVIEADQNRA